MRPRPMHSCALLCRSRFSPSALCVHQLTPARCCCCGAVQMWVPPLPRTQLRMSTTRTNRMNRRSDVFSVRLCLRVCVCCLCVQLPSLAKNQR